MKAYHNSRELEYREPYGAVNLGGTVKLCVDIWETNDAKCTLRLWVDGKGETLIPMEREWINDRFRFSCQITPKEPELLWYHFIIEHDGGITRCGARQGSVGGESALYPWEPPSFQITVYKERKVPKWYKDGIVYQIFPDRFNRGQDWKERANKALARHRNGPDRALTEDWYKYPIYQKDDQGRVTLWEFYGGTLSGICEKLDYLQDMGITALYLNPLFEAASNHRYDTADYTRIDPMLGDNSDFERLVQEAEKRDIHIILDGVFNHTGCDSIYFDKYGNYGGAGAYKNPQSEYRKWYSFSENDEKYAAWWGVDDLPDVDEENEDYRRFIYGGRDSVVRHWLRAGAKGFRLDVADEMPDDFIAGIKKSLTETISDGLLLGEVWEDASNKVSYGKLRRYLLGDELDSAMNYPLRDAVLSYVLGKIPAGTLGETIEALRENYPKEAFYSALNMMGSHDKARLMTVLGDAPEEQELTEEQRWEYRLPDDKRGLAKGRLWLVTLLQMTLPGVPCIYYGDEAGMEGYSDPYNRASFPWGKEDHDAESIYRNAMSFRKLYRVFTDGELEILDCCDDVLLFVRRNEEECAAVAVNRSLSESHEITMPLLGEGATELISGSRLSVSEGTVKLGLPPMGSAVILFHSRIRLAKPMERGSGVLCHITSLPNGGMPGTMGEPAKRFIDFLSNLGQKYWQILPINPTDEHGSPYAGVSAFAGNIALIDTAGKTLEELCEGIDIRAYNAFCRENADWLDPYSVFAAIRDNSDGLIWQKWRKKYRKYSVNLLKDEKISERIDFYKKCQYIFMKQWNELRKYAAKKGIMIIGDMPMYVSEDSSDVWANQELFELDENGYKASQAGVPPDYFCEEGQLWGNPLYNWKAMRDNGYSWWLDRLERAFGLFDYVRLDHFRGFEMYWSVPKGEKAVNGKWRPGPGRDLFKAAYKKFGDLALIAEDLGMITPGVRGLVAACGFEGMDIVQFYNGDPLSSYIPPKEKIAYSGTHDNQTLMGWCADRYGEENSKEASSRIMENIMKSEAQVVIFQLQDILYLGDEARMNTPGTVDINWSWRVKEENIDSCTKELLEKTIKYGRNIKGDNDDGRLE